MAALTGEQRHVIRALVRIGRKRGRKAKLSTRERRKMIDTAIAAGYTESRWRNLNRGDRDSLGWRQERAQYYKNPRNLKASIHRFYDEYLKDAPRGGSIGQRAQAVQQSGTPNVWDGMAPMAARLREKFTGPGGGAGGGGRARAPRGKSRRVGVKAPGYQAAYTRTDTTQAILDSILNRRTRQGASLIGDVVGRVDSGAYTTEVAAKHTAGKYKTIRGKAGKRRKGKGGGPKGVRDGGGWAGTKNVAEQAGRGYIASRKRTPAQNAAAGGSAGSDHLTTNRRAYAVDMAAGDGVARKVARRLGLGKRWRAGSYDRHVVKIGGRRYSVQLLWKVKGHYDHVHLGVQRL